jgi:histone deacetylase 1/2
MLDYTPYTHKEYLVVANGGREAILGEGSVQVSLETGKTFMLHNVKHVPTAKKRLLSVGKAYLDGINVNIMGIDCYLTDTNGVLLAHAEHIYPYQWLCDTSIQGSVEVEKEAKRVSFTSDTEFHESCATQLGNSVEVDRWHQRLAHLSPYNMGRMRREGMVTGMDLPPSDLSKLVGIDGVCDACLSGKMTSGPFKSTGNVCTQKLEVVHMDLMGPIDPESCDDAKYALVIVDEFSEFSTVVLLQSKSQASKEAQRVLKEWEVSHDCRVKHVRTDNGSEFSALSRYCSENGTVHQKTAPYAHQQNGKVERLNRTLQERTRSLLAASGLGPEFWGEALLTANHVRNLSAVSNLTVTPFEAMFDKKPSVSHLRVFGSKCRVLILKNKREGKFGSVSCEGVFVGYDTHSKNYRILVDNVIGVYNHEIVRFQENLADASQNPSPQQGEAADTPVVSQVPESAGPVFSVSDNTEGDEPGMPCGKIMFGDFDGSANDDSERVVAHHPRVQVPRSAGVQDVPQVDPLDSVEESVSLESVDLGEPQTDVPVSPVGPFRGRYPVRVRNPERNWWDLPASSHAVTVEPFAGYVQVQKDTIIVEPKTYVDALQSDEADKWVASMEEEMNSLFKLGTWSYVEVSDRQRSKALPVKWVYKLKLTETGEVERFKARLVAKGFKQVYGVDYTEVYAPVSKHSTLRYLLSKAVHRNMHVHQMDVSTAFLHGTIQEKIHVQQPQGFHVGGSNTVCLLHKALYGLKQAPRAWYETISGVLLSSGFRVSDADPSLFILKEPGVADLFLLLYVDDILLFCTEMGVIKKVKGLVASHFAVKDLGEAKHFLGMQIVQERDASGVLRSISLSNEKLTSDILESFDMSQVKPKAVPMDKSQKLKKGEGTPLPKENRYRELVGGIQYLAITVRPDIAHAAALLGRFSSAPTLPHWNAGMHVLRYLAGTKSLGLKWSQGSSGVVGYVDSDFAGDLDGWCSTSGFIFLSGGAAVSWGSKLQRIAALSTVEAEFIAMCLGVQELLWLVKLVHDVGDPVGAVTLYSDNTGALANVKGIPVSPRTKHIGVRYHRIRGELQRGSFNPTYVPSAENIADVFTKPLAKVPYSHLRGLTGVR